MRSSANTNAGSQPVYRQVGKYTLGRTLGTGTFSQVKIAMDDEGALFAIKIIDKELAHRQRMEKQVKCEMQALKLLQHPHIVRLYECLQTKRNLYLVLELVTGGELYGRLLSAQRFDEATARRYFQQLVMAVHYCHQQNVAHRDLKPENLLVDDKDNIKIIDFGLSQFHEAGVLMRATCGTPNYMAPEVFQGEYNGLAADVWSCGVILYVMLTGRLPFKDPNVAMLASKIARAQDHICMDDVPAAAHDLIKRIMTVDPSKRYTLNDVIKHRWFRPDFNFKMLAAFRGTKRATEGSVNTDDSQTAETPQQDPLDTTVTSTRTPSWGTFELLTQRIEGH